MAYCRFGPDSDVYFYKTLDGWECCRCSLNSGEFVYLANFDAAYAHIQDHVKAGHKVPDKALSRLRKEASEI
jgi:hypothetical protein